MSVVLERRFKGYLRSYWLIATIVLSSWSAASEEAPNYGPANRAMAAVGSATHPLSGIWKTDCENFWGYAIHPGKSGKYKVTACGKGCLDHSIGSGEETSIYGDDIFQVIDTNTLKLKATNPKSQLYGKYTTWKRCPKL